LVRWVLKQTFAWHQTDEVDGERPLWGHQQFQRRERGQDATGRRNRPRGITRGELVRGIDTQAEADPLSRWTWLLALVGRSAPGVRRGRSDQRRLPCNLFWVELEDDNVRQCAK